MDKQTGRFFIAVPLPEPLKQGIKEILDPVKKELSFQKWVYPSDLHITLVFLGDTPLERLDSICEALGETAGRFEAFRLRIEQFGTFGAEAAPRVLWAGVQGDTAALQALQGEVAEAMRPLGFEPEKRPYRAHLTLARRYNGPQGGSRRAMETLAIPQGADFTWTAREITLYETRLGSEPMYRAAAAFPLKDPS